jgi:hypothetical protein
MLAHVQHARDASQAKDDGVLLSSKLMSQPGLRSLLVFGALCALGGAAANAQNLDQGKSATQLFNDSCTTCHRNAGGLAKGRSRGALLQFLQEHYSSSSATAAELASYLASVDRPQGGRSRPAAGNPPRPPDPRSVRARQHHPPDRIETGKKPASPTDRRSPP